MQQHGGNIWSYFRDFVGAQKIEDLSESKIFFAEVFQITSTFLLARKKFGVRCTLKGPSQPPPFSMTSKLLIKHGEVNSYCFTVSCVPEGMFNYLKEFYSVSTGSD